MDDFFKRMMADRMREDDDAPKMSLEGQLANLREFADRFARRNPFKLGDVVTPIAGGDMRGAGSPHVVIDLREPEAIFVGDSPASNVFGRKLDMRVASYGSGHLTTHWVESAYFDDFKEVAAAETAKAA